MAHHAPRLAKQVSKAALKGKLYHSRGYMAERRRRIQLEKIAQRANKKANT